MDHGIGDGLVGRCSMIFQESFNKDSKDENDEWWQWVYMMNVDLNMDNLKDYVGIYCILESWNPPTQWRHVSSLSMLNFNAYKKYLKGFQHWPHSLLNVWCRWIMSLVMGLLEDVLWHFDRVLKMIPYMGMTNDDNETVWWMLMKTWMISNIIRACHASLSLETLPHHEGMCLI